MPQTADMPLAFTRDEALRTALAAPVEGENVETAAAQLGDRLAVAFDELRAPLDDHDGTTHSLYCRVPAREAEPGSVARQGKPDLAMPGNRVVGEGKKLGLGHQ